MKRAYYIEDAFNKSEAEVRAFFRDRIETVFKNVPVREHAAETLRSLHKRGHMIHLITARDERHRPVTENWLQRHKIPYHSLRMSPPNQSYSKGTLCKELGVTFFVDDKIENAEDTSSKGVYTLLYYASHNRDYKTSLPTVKNWLEVQAHIELVLRNTPL